jgi:hypothetical protein
MRLLNLLLLNKLLKDFSVPDHLLAHDLDSNVFKSLKDISEKLFLQGKAFCSLFYLVSIL